MKNVNLKVLSRKSLLAIAIILCCAFIQSCGENSADSSTQSDSTAIVSDSLIQDTIATSQKQPEQETSAKYSEFCANWYDAPSEAITVNEYKDIPMVEHKGNIYVRCPHCHNYAVNVADGSEGSSFYCSFCKKTINYVLKNPVSEEEYY